MGVPPIPLTWTGGDAAPATAAVTAPPTAPPTAPAAPTEAPASAVVAFDPAASATAAAGGGPGWAEVCSLAELEDDISDSEGGEEEAVTSCYDFVNVGGDSTDVLRTILQTPPHPAGHREILKGVGKAKSKGKAKGKAKTCVEKANLQDIG